jgi:hypothetical protein
VDHTTETGFLDAVGRTAEILAAIERSIMDENRQAIERLTLDLHAELSGFAGRVPGSPEDHTAVLRIRETTLKLEKLLADRMASKDSVPVRRKPKHRPGLVTYQS